MPNRIPEEISLPLCLKKVICPLSALLCSLLAAFGLSIDEGLVRRQKRKGVKKKSFFLSFIMNSRGGPLR